MKNIMTRREIIGLGAVTGAAFLGAQSAATETKAEPAPSGKFPWEYRALDAASVRKRAYDNHFKGGCMFGVFEAIAGMAAEKLGKPYTDFPFQLSTYGGGGVASWGTLCGVCNGAAMACSMFLDGALRSQAINEIFFWYENTALPLFVPEKPVKVKPEFQMKASLSESTLCHVSIARWSAASGLPAFSPERAERCARLVADTAGFTAELLNMILMKKFTPKHQTGIIASGCLECHAQGNHKENEPEVVSKMSCTACHPDAHNKKEQG